MIVLYESLCPDSKNYINNFWPVYRKYHQCINLTLVPYGKASVSLRYKNLGKCPLFN